jgi:hypothetical protein
LTFRNRNSKKDGAARNKQVAILRHPRALDQKLIKSVAGRVLHERLLVFNPLQERGEKDQFIIIIIILAWNMKKGLRGMQFDPSSAPFQQVHRARKALQESR